MFGSKAGWGVRWRERELNELHGEEPSRAVTAGGRDLVTAGRFSAWWRLGPMHPPLCGCTEEDLDRNQGQRMGVGAITRSLPPPRVTLRLGSV